MIDSEPREVAPEPRRRRRAVLVSLVALAVLAGAGTVIWRSIRQDVEWALTASARANAPGAAPAPPQAKKDPSAEDGEPGRPIGEDEPAYWSEVAVFKAGPGRPRPVVVVRQGKQLVAEYLVGLDQGLLAREVVRQGFMLAAREELGALVRDDVPIGDPGLTEKPDATCRIGSKFRKRWQTTEADPPVGRITIVTGDGANRRVLWSREFDCDMVISPYYGRLVTQVERFARGGFRKVLEDLGVSRPAPAPKNRAGGELPAGVEDQLGRLVETEPFAAIRTLHEAVRAGGDSKALLIGLARAYANLGSLTESQWTADCHAYAARSLLYAQRAAIRDQDGPSLRGQAYAEALAGLFREAQSDFEAADKADGGKDVPAWAEAARVYTHSDAAALAKLAALRPGDPLPLYLRFLTLSHNQFVINHEQIVCRGEVVAAGRAVLEKVPDCYRVHDGMAEAQGVSNLHSSTTVGMEQFATAVPRRLAAVPGLPASIAEAITRGAGDEVDLRKRLVAAAADDPSDLSWGALARQLREIRFLQVCRRLHFVAYRLAASPSSTAEAARPLVADHPNRLYVAYFAAGADAQGLVAMYRSLDLDDIERKAETLIFPLQHVDQDLYKHFVQLCGEHTCLGTVRGQEIITFTSGDDCATEAHNLLKYNPDSPTGRAALITTKWDEAQPSAGAWVKDHGGGDTLVIAALGLHWLKEKKFDEAQRLLEQALARSPDGWIFDALAETYRTTGQVDRWTKAVDDYLKTEDQSLDHAHATANLAQYLLNAGEFEKARPYAELAAESGAGWAMNGAARCAEKMGDWEAAERWIALSAQRYQNSWLDWFFWCKRSGHGNARAAASLVEAHLAAGRTPNSDDEATNVAILLMLDGRPNEARTILEPLFQAKHNPTDGIFLALACDQAGDAAARDAVMKGMAEDPKPRGPKTAKLLGVLLDWLTHGKKSPPDLERINTILGEMPKSRPNSEAIVGILLDRHGQRDVAMDYLKRANVKETAFAFRLLAMDALRARGIDPGLFPW